MTINYDTFKKSKFIAALIVFLFGQAFLEEYKILGISLIFISILLPFYTDGIEIDLKQNRYRYFNSFFGIKRGVWYSFSNYTCLIIKFQKGTRELIGAKGAVSTTLKGQQYEVVIANDSHRNQLILKHFEEKKSALVFANRMSKLLKFPIETYNPTVSSKTKRRRK